MKGLLFTQLFDMVEQEYSYQFVDTLLLTTDLPSGGIYTPAGTYPSYEMSRLLANLSERTNRTKTELLQNYGRFMFNVFVVNYRHFIHSASDAFSFLSSVDAIHMEFRKLHPDAEVPTISVYNLDEESFQLVYRSQQAMADMVYGIIDSTLLYFNENAVITQQFIGDDDSQAIFNIVKQNKKSII